MGFLLLYARIYLYILSFYLFFVNVKNKESFIFSHFWTKIYSRSCTQNWTVTPLLDPRTMISTAGQRTDGLTSQGHRLASISTPILWPPSNLNRFQMSSRFRLVHLQSSEYNISLKFLKSNLILVVLMECNISPVPSVTFIWINNPFCVFLPSLKVFILKLNQQCRYNLVLRQKESFLKWFFTN